MQLGLGPENSSNIGYCGGGGDVGLQRRKQGRLLTVLPIITIGSRWASVSHLQKWNKKMSQGSCEVQTLKMDIMLLVLVRLIIIV